MHFGNGPPSAMNCYAENKNNVTKNLKVPKSQVKSECTMVSATIATTGPVSKIRMHCELWLFAFWLYLSYFIVFLCFDILSADLLLEFFLSFCIHWIYTAIYTMHIDFYFLCLVACMPCIPWWWWWWIVNTTLYSSNLYHLIKTIHSSVNLRDVCMKHIRTLSGVWGFFVQFFLFCIFLPFHSFRFSFQPIHLSSLHCCL